MSIWQKIKEFFTGEVEGNNRETQLTSNRFGRKKKVKNFGVSRGGYAPGASPRLDSEIQDTAEENRRSREYQTDDSTLLPGIVAAEIFSDRQRQQEVDQSFDSPATEEEYDPAADSSSSSTEGSNVFGGGGDFGGGGAGGDWGQESPSSAAANDTESDDYSSSSDDYSSTSSDYSSSSDDSSSDSGGGDSGGGDGGGGGGD